jgi:hypothetical protein
MVGCCLRVFEFVDMETLGADAGSRIPFKPSLRILETPTYFDFTGNGSAELALSPLSGERK